MRHFLKIGAFLWEYDRPDWPILSFPTSGFLTVDPSTTLEEEKERHFSEGVYCPVNIGDVLNEHYQVVGKLGFGRESTCWLARDIKKWRYVTLKIFIRGKENQTREVETYELLRQHSNHPGQGFIREILGKFKIPRPDQDSHICLVHKPLLASLYDVLCMTGSQPGRNIVKRVIWETLSALDYLHRECKLVHTDIKPDNIMYEIDDDYILEKFVRDELDEPSPRKIVDGHPVYCSRLFDPPKSCGKSFLCDFGRAVSGEEERNENCQPVVSRSPEALLAVNWSYPVDIWNVGVMTWLLLEGNSLFTCKHPTTGQFSSAAHLGQISGILGPPPLDLLKRGECANLWYDEEGNLKDKEITIVPRNLENDEAQLEGEEKKEFLFFMRCMIQWRPEDRKTTAELLEHTWLNFHS
ncbi:protein kinase domain protein [Penicillium angulare]|uniref:non-specific serine/threonine protein kinase n=1 Tax=Penicillium angulare TaxID=116970 RepID=A0A9W9ET46_9EURO|nr:protein kinase domain protein [Penicillium angulare]